MQNAPYVVQVHSESKLRVVDGEEKSQFLDWPVVISILFGCNWDSGCLAIYVPMFDDLKWAKRCMS
jgi:hypothetical protein